MATLTCGARHCAYNEGGVCSAGIILIEGMSSDSSIDTYCSSYKDKTASGLDSIYNTNYMNSVTQGFYSAYEYRNSPEVSCNAVRCFYNFNGSCQASQVSVYGDENGILGTRCQSFTY
jgi:hypothetical protein